LLPLMDLQDENETDSALIIIQFIAVCFMYYWIIAKPHDALMERAILLGRNFDAKTR
jgi:hypothetical protein